MKNVLRDKNNFKVLRNINQPVMFLSLPLYLAIIYLGAIVFSVILSLILSSTNLSLGIKFGAPILVAGTIIPAINKFYKTYGINGFYLKQRDSTLTSEIRADKSITQILKERHGN